MSQLETTERVLVATPSYDGSITLETHHAIMDCMRRRNGVQMIADRSKTTSLLPHTFNLLWIEALERREDIDWFAMIHADMCPQKGWLSEMVLEARRVGATILSAVIRIKETSGDFSTAMEYHQDGQLHRRRLHVHDLETLPRTFTREDVAKAWKLEEKNCEALLLNTGLWIADMRASWIEKVAFRLRSGIDFNDKGEPSSWVESEDWELSRDLHAMGVTTHATSVVQVHHVGMIRYDNWPESCKLDERPQEEPAAIGR